MSNNQVLIITDNRSSFYAEPYSLSPEKCRITGLDSIRYLGFSGVNAVVIDCASISGVLKKVSLGIRDNAETQALWELLAMQGGPRVYLLVEKMQKPGNEMMQMGIEYIIPAELRKLVADAAPATQTREAQAAEFRQQLLTADDIRDLHQKGARQLPAGSRLTAWASEIADSLNLHAAEHKLHLLLPVKITSKEQLAGQHENLYSLASRYPSLLFMVNEIYLPVFNSLFPSLGGRTVAPSAHWASHGAYTGETSVQMLVDQRCFGAVVPACKPYSDPENLKKLAKLAHQHGLALFCTFTLASAGTCDIIATDGSGAGAMIPLYQAGVVSPGKLPESGAIVVDNEFLQQITIRKGN